MPKPESPTFKFEISLSVLNHLGRNLYRNFITVLGEAISNSWDADAKNVWISIDRNSNVFSIKDDGIGMSGADFQDKFLRIGYSKRSNGKMRTRSGRPFIGAKGIGKLALLSCARRISIFTKKSGQSYVGGVIDNSGLDLAIKSDLTPEKYPLEGLDFELISDLKKKHRRGTIIVFEDSKDQIRNSIAQIRKLLALNFRFSILDENFAIHVNEEEVTITDLSDLIKNTQYSWSINDYSDDFTVATKKVQRKKFALSTALEVKGFIASVAKPGNLKISGTEERATIDLFVNGRLREKNILRHIPTQRIVESYLYGQIHFDAMDVAGKDPFTSSREGILEEDANFQSLLDYLKRDALPKIFNTWDKNRLERGDEGDDENVRKSKKERKALDLYAAAREEYEPATNAPNRDKVDGWLDGLRPDAEFNLASYADCFLSENLVRKYVQSKNLVLSPGVIGEAAEWRKREVQKKGRANLSIDLRKVEDDLSYLGMDALAISAEGKKDDQGKPSLCTDAISYAPVRNVVGHTGLLTDVAKNHLRHTYENIKARIKKLISAE